MGEKPEAYKSFSLSSARREQTDVIPSDRRRGKRRDLGDVIRWRDLDDVHSREVEAREPMEDGPRLPGRQPAHFGRSGPRRKGGVESIDIESQIGGADADDLANAPGDGSRPSLVHVLGSNDRHPLADGPIEDVAVQWGADADLDRVMRIDQPLFDGVVKRRAVAPGEPKAFGPGIDVAVEMNEAERPLAARQGAQQRDRDRVVAAERDQMPQRNRLGLDLGEAALDVAMRDV